MLLYSFSLLTTAISHMHEVPDVWTASVRTVAWFAVPSDSVESPRSSTEKPRLSDDVFVEDAKRSSLHFPTPIFERHAKALPLSPQSEHTPESPAAAPPIWHARRRSSVPSLDLPPPPSKRTTWTSRMFSGVPSLSHKCSIESVRPSWAKTGGAAGRRGVDHPFAMPRPGGPALKPLVLPTIRPLRTMKLKSCWSASTSSGGESHPPPALPPKARARLSGVDPATGLSPTSTFYIDLERDAVVSVGAPSLGRPLSYDMFPEDVVDPDAPITRSQPSTWIRAHSPASSTSASR